MCPRCSCQDLDRKSENKIKKENIIVRPRDPRSGQSCTHEAGESSSQSNGCGGRSHGCCRQSNGCTGRRARAGADLLVVASPPRRPPGRREQLPPWQASKERWTPRGAAPWMSEDGAHGSGGGSGCMWRGERQVGDGASAMVGRGGAREVVG